MSVRHKFNNILTFVADCMLILRILLCLLICMCGLFAAWMLQCRSYLPACISIRISNLSRTFPEPFGLLSRTFPVATPFLPRSYHVP